MRTAASQPLKTPQSSEPLTDPAAAERPLWPLALGGFGLILIAAALLWLRFGPAVFLDSLTAVWNCI